jgi:hypothetical protein
VKSGRFALALALASLPTLVWAGEGRYLTDEPGSWSAWNFRTYEFSTRLSGATHEDARALGEWLRGLDEILRRTPPAARPVGFRCESWGTGATYMYDVPGRPRLTQMPLQGGVTFGAFALFEYKRDGKWIRDKGGETQLMSFAVNNLEPRVLGNEQIPDDWKGLTTDAFIVPEQTGTVAGFPRYVNYIVIKKKAAPIWLPLSLDAALRLSAEAAKKSLRAAQETKFPIAGQAQKLAEVVARVEARIAALSPEDRQAAACWIRDYRMPMADRVQKADTPGCLPVATPNWAFFDLRLPRSAPQVVLVTGIGRCYEGKQDGIGGCQVNRPLLESLDRQALMNWLQ